MKYRVYDKTTYEDITDKYYWVIRPDGTLYYNEYGDLIGYPNAIYISVNNHYKEDKCYEQPTLNWLTMNYFDERYGRVYKCPHCGKERIGTAKYCDECANPLKE